MSGRFKVIGALMCEDVRQEVNDAISLIGVATPTLECANFPARRRLSPVLLVDTLETGPATFKVELKWRGKLRYGIEVEIEIDEVSKGVPLPVRGTVGNFDRPGTLALDVIIDDRRKTVQKWIVQKGTGGDAETALH